MFWIGLGRILFGRMILDNRYPADYLCRISDKRRITGYCDINLQYTIRVGPYVCMSVQTSIYMSVCKSVNMYELLLIYCNTNKNLRNFAFVCMFKGIFVVKYKKIKLTDNRPDIENAWKSSPTLVLNNLPCLP